MHSAIITVTGSRASYELPVYGSKCIGVRQGALDLHGAPTGTQWTRLAATAAPNATSIKLRESVTWAPGSLIIIASTSFNQEEAEPVRVVSLAEDGTLVELSRPLKFEHLGDGWSAEGYDAHTSLGWREGEDHIPQYSAEVGLLSRNVVVTGDYLVSRREQFGVQVVMHSRGDNAAIGRFSNVEVQPKADIIMVINSSCFRLAFR